jgi:glucose dehydrogenase
LTRFGGHHVHESGSRPPSTGAQLWAARYDGGGSGNDIAYAVAVSPDSSKVFVTGPSVGANSIGNKTDYDYATVAYSTT